MKVAPSSDGRPGKLCVLIADDDPRVRRDFTLLLELDPGIEVVATAEDGAAAVALAERLRPQVVVMDVRMPVMDGIEATRRVRAACGDSCRILVVTTFDLDDYVLGAVRAGAGGFLLKDQAPEQLVEAVHIVASGEAIVSPRATARLLTELATPPGPASGSPQDRLTERERDIVRWMARGLSNEEIAEQARITRSTVKSHVSSILLKLSLTSRIQIVVWAYENGMVSPRR